MRKIKIIQRQCPGDVLALTAAIEALHAQYPNQFETNVECVCPEIFYNNPHVKRIIPPYEKFDISYPAIQRCGDEPLHIIQCFIEDLSDKLKVPIKCDRNRPSLYLNELEKIPFKDIQAPYIVINCGYKVDYECKTQGHNISQEIIDEFKDKFTFVQIGEKEAVHKPLNSVINLIGKTKHRDLIRLAYHSVLGIGPITYLHHIYGALQKPYICYCGGREPPSFVQYPTAIMLSTMGQMNCCRLGGCWKTTLNQPDPVFKHRLCPLPVINGDETIPKCMNILGSESAIRAINTMLNNGLLL